MFCAVSRLVSNPVPTKADASHRCLSGAAAGAGAGAGGGGGAGVGSGSMTGGGGGGGSGAGGRGASLTTAAGTAVALTSEMLPQIFGTANVYVNPSPVTLNCQASKGWRPAHFTFRTTSAVPP